MRAHHQPAGVKHFMRAVDLRAQERLDSLEGPAFNQRLMLPWKPSTAVENFAHVRTVLENLIQLAAHEARPGLTPVDAFGQQLLAQAVTGVPLVAV
jgi:hypothetical protein